MKPVLLLLVFFAATSGLSDAGVRPLSPCPDSPNCVCSEPPTSSVDPLPVGTDPARSWAVLLDCIRTMNGDIVQSEDGYVHALFSSRVFGFVDDLECRLDGAMIHVRSASRTGWWDMGVNRKRITTLRLLYADQLSR